MVFARKTIIWVLMLCVASSAIASAVSFPDCTVSKLTGTIKPDSFTCKVSDKSHLAFLPLTVRIRGIQASSQTDVAKEATAFVQSQLKSAKRITLKNIEMTGYCVIEADVIVDNKHLAEQIVKRSLSAVPQPEPVQPKVLPRQVLRKSPLPVKTARKERDISLSYQSKIKFEPEMTYEEAFDMIANSTLPKLPLLIMWHDLEKNCFIDGDTPIELEFDGPIKIEKALQILVDSFDGQYAVDGGVITVASSQMNLPQKMITKVYDIRELVNSKQQYYNNTGNNSNQTNQYNNSQTNSGRN